LGYASLKRLKIFLFGAIVFFYSFVFYSINKKACQVFLAKILKKFSY